MYSKKNQSNSVQTGACRCNTAVVTTPRITSQVTKHLPSQAPTKNNTQHTPRKANAHSWMCFCCVLCLAKRTQINQLNRAQLAADHAWCCVYHQHTGYQKAACNLPKQSCRHNVRERRATGRRGVRCRAASRRNHTRMYKLAFASWEQQTVSRAVMSGHVDDHTQTRAHRRGTPTTAGAEAHSCGRWQSAAALLLAHTA
ncbi:hypothetical protein COO60DRAFT_325682 [Scenedesmus sp. NREL 46B-D3]|nr:hypothetical protein COO60DRAFT_325682 [Scenedesmus sp. NREL 46B-D3]